MRLTLLAVAAAGMLTACAQAEKPDGVLIETPRKLVGGACVGTVNLPKGTELYAQKLDIDDAMTTTALVAIALPANPLPFMADKNGGLISARFRDTANIPAFAPGARTYQDNLRDGLRAGEGSRHTERNGALVFEGFTGGTERYFLVNDAAKTILTCDMSEGEKKAWCDVDTVMDGGRYRLITTFAYAKRLQFQDMVREAEGLVRKAFVPCP